MLLKNPAVAPLRELVGKRLLEPGQMVQAHKQLNQMLVTLWTAGYIQLDPKPTPLSRKDPGASSGTTKVPGAPSAPAKGLLTSAGLGQLVSHAQATSSSTASGNSNDQNAGDAVDDDESPQDAASGTRAAQLERDDEASRGYDLENYQPITATPTERLDLLVHLRTINPLYGVYMAGHLAIADDAERLAHSKARWKCRQCRQVSACTTTGSIACGSTGHYALG